MTKLLKKRYSNRFARYKSDFQSPIPNELGYFFLFDSLVIKKTIKAITAIQIIQLYPIPPIKPS